MPFQSINPATGRLVLELPEDPPERVEQALIAAGSAFDRWRDLSFAARAGHMRNVAARLRADSPRLAGLMTLEMGKPIAEAEAEIEKCAWCCDFYAENAEKFLADLVTPSGATESYVAFDPVGIVLAIMPWNFPFWQVFRFAAPSLMAGNVAVLKHASNVPQCARAIEQVFREAGLPEAVFQTLMLPSNRIDQLIADERIMAVTLTGSDLAGSKVAESSGRELKKTVLELGGSDPFIVLADADIDAAAGVAVSARYQNTGQSCIAAKRFIVVEDVREAFLGAFVAGIEKLKTGDPTRRDTQVGPLAREDLVEGIEEQVKRSVEAGARVVTGGRRMPGEGYFYEPTVLAGVRPGMPVFDEETFGPVAAVIGASGSDEAIDLANQSRYGLGSALWTRNIVQGKRLARRIESGAVFINGMVASDPRLPFGGVKRSGYGRELGEWGIREFVNIKTVWVGPKTG